MLSSDPWNWDIFPFIYTFIKLFWLCLVVFRVYILYLLTKYVNKYKINFAKLISAFYSFWFYRKYFFFLISLSGCSLQVYKYTIYFIFWPWILQSYWTQLLVSIVILVDFLEISIYKICYLKVGIVLYLPNYSAHILLLFLPNDSG